MINSEKLANKNILFVSNRFIKLKFGTLLLVKFSDGTCCVVRYSGFNSLGNLYFKEYYTRYSSYNQYSSQSNVKMEQITSIKLLTKTIAVDFFSRTDMNKTLRNIFNELET